MQEWQPRTYTISALTTAWSKQRTSLTLARSPIRQTWECLDLNSIKISRIRSWIRGAQRGFSWGTIGGVQRISLVTQTEGPLGDDDFIPLWCNINPDVCSASDVDKPEKGLDELAEGPEAMNETNPTCQPLDESVRHSKRERKPPAYLKDYVTHMEGDDQVLKSID